MIRKTLALLAIALFSGAASAHPGDVTTGFVAGALHPLSGADHLLAMLAIGMWAAQSRNRMLAPGLFLAGMFAGSCYVLFGGALPWAEHGIAFSVIAAGLLLAFVRAQDMAATIALPLIVAGAALHGYAHAAEAPAAAQTWMYMTGFGAATALLLELGIALGRLPWIGVDTQEQLRRFAGFGIASIGSVLLLGV